MRSIIDVTDRAAARRSREAARQRAVALVEQQRRREENYRRRPRASALARSHQRWVAKGVTWGPLDP
jgi:hypothetical protein